MFDDVDVDSSRSLCLLLRGVHRRRSRVGLEGWGGLWNTERAMIWAKLDDIKRQSRSFRRRQDVDDPVTAVKGSREPSSDGLQLPEACMPLRRYGRAGAARAAPAFHVKAGRWEGLAKHSRWEAPAFGPPYRVLCTRVLLTASVGTVLGSRSRHIRPPPQTLVLSPQTSQARRSQTPSTGVRDTPHPNVSSEFETGVRLNNAYLLRPAVRMTLAINERPRTLAQQTELNYG